MSGPSASTPNLDPFSVGVFFITSFGIAGDGASIASAYGVIALSALGGAAWSASGTPGLSRVGTILHILMMLGLAMVATVPLAELVSRVSGVEIRWLLSPFAIVIAARPDWVLTTVRKWFVKRAGLDDPGADPPKEKQP